MKTGSVLACLGAAALSTWGAPVRYKDAVFADVTTASNILYGGAKNHAGVVEQLLMDVYQPAGDTAKARPLLIFIHGGGFSAGSKTDGDIVFLCRTFAMKGYVTASFGYRLETPLSTLPAMATEIVRAVQDGKAAVRYLRAHKADYKIDDSRIMMGGTSAGGALSVNYAYMENDEIPSYIDTASIGGMEGSSGTPGVSSAINGIINCWGGIGDSTVLDDARLPAISFHGTNDNTVPYDVGYALGNPALTMVGSACVHRVLTRKGVRSVLKPFVGMGHGIPGGDKRTDTLVTMTTDFAYEILFGSSIAIRGAGRTETMPGPLWRTQPGFLAAPDRNDRAGGKVFSADGRVFILSPLP